VTWAVFTAAIASALLHALWNMLGKTRSAPPEMFVGIVLATASICTGFLPIVGVPNPQSWPWIIGSSLCNALYLQVVMRAYAAGQFNVVYAIVRAVIPPTLFVFGWLLLAEVKQLHALVGVALIVISLSLFATLKIESGKSQRRSLLLAVVAGFLLALSLLCDVKGIRVGGLGMFNLFRYSVASSLTTASILIVSSLLLRQNPFAALKGNTGQCYLGAALLLLSYLCGMWAYVHGPIGLVAPLRESGILLGGLLSVAILRERVTELQWAAMGLATIGVVLIQVG